MHKLIDKFDLTRLYDRYSRLVTDEGRKQFVRVAYTLSLFVVTIIVMWYCGIPNINTRSQNFTTSLKLTEAEKPSAPSSIKSEDDIKQGVNSAKETNKESTDKQIADNIINQNAEISKPSEPSKQTEPAKQLQPAKQSVSEPKTDLKQTKDKLPKKDYGIVKKTIYMGANTTLVALTFDDGYNQKNVEKVLDALKKNNVKSTFFIIGKVLDDYPEVWKRAVNEGHQICNHTNYHEVLTNMPDNLVQNEILGWETSAKKILGEDYVVKMKKEFPYLRLPGGGGAKSDRILSIAQKNGYTVIGWNLETFSSVINPFKKTKSVKEISNKIEQHVVNKCSNGSIILLHFNQYDSGNIEGIIQGIKNRGFNMQTISQIIKSTK